MICLTTISLLIASVVIHAADIDDSLSNYSQQFAKAIGLSADFVFSAGTNYPPIAEDVTFWCITPDDDKFEQVFAKDSTAVLQNLIDFTLPINFLIHGYIDSFHGSPQTGSTGWQNAMAREFSKRTQSNVCAVDWSRLASYLYMITAFIHTHKVANHVTEFIRVLEANGADIGQMTIIGHSLGAQTAGFIGANLGGILKAIYGLDPAGPGFSYPFDTSIVNRLDPTDAQYVQCIHTARKTFGINYNCGHADFYPNLGFHMPGCITPICSHSHAVVLFRSSIDPSHPFVGTHCASDDEAVQKAYQCSSIQESMGIYKKGARGTFYMYTTPNEPYCLNCKASELTAAALKAPVKINPLRRRSQEAPTTPSQVNSGIPSTMSTGTGMPQANQFEWKSDQSIESNLGRAVPMFLAMLRA